MQSVAGSWSGVLNGEKSFGLDSRCPTPAGKLTPEKVKKSEKVLNSGGGGRRRVASASLGKAESDGVKYYAHTAEDTAGNRLSEQHWQPLVEHLRNVADLAKKFAAPLGLPAEAELAGLVHGLFRILRFRIEA